MGGGDSSSTIQPTEDQITEEQNNAKLWNYYEQNYNPVIQQYAAETTNSTTKAAQQNQVAGQINAEEMKNAPPATANPAKNVRQLSSLTQAADVAQQSGQLKVGEVQAGDVQNVVNIGRGQATNAVQNQGDIASQSIGTEIKQAQLNLQEKGATEEMYGGLVGGAVGGATVGYLRSLDMTGTSSGGGTGTSSIPGGLSLDSEDPYVTY